MNHVLPPSTASMRDLRGFVGHYHHRRNRTLMRQVLRNLHLPASLEGVSSRTPWGITMVRDEEDVIEQTLLHQLGQGIRPIIVADNLSRDATPRIVAALAEKHPVYLAQDTLPAYHQAEKMTALASLASRRGASWVVPFDADENWYARDMSVSAFLEGCPSDVVRATLHNVFPSATGWRMDMVSDGPGKVAFRSSRFALVRGGNHGVMRSGARTHGLFIAHYPWRSLEQLQRKAAQGSEALEARDPSDRDFGAHWHLLAEARDDMASVWQAVFTQQPHPKVNQSVVGPFLDADPRAWRTWSADPAPSAG